MKPFYFFIAAALCCIAMSCSKKDSSGTSDDSLTSATKLKSLKDKIGSMNRDDSSLHSTIISIDSANKMLTSYLYSIPSDKSETTLRSFTFNADSLRDFLSDPNIKNVKLMFAHRLDYINAGNNGVDAGLSSNALTIIIAGYDANGNYKYVRNGVLDHSQPCPTSCGVTGTAASYTLSN